MEKYRQFADPGTGINPFVPPWSHYKLTIPGRAAKMLLIPAALLRLSVFMVAMVWIALSQLVCQLLPAGIVRRPFQRILQGIGCFVALLGLGVINLSQDVADHRRLKLAAPKKAWGAALAATPGMLVFVNQQSLVDILYLGMKLSPTFVFVASDGSPVEFSLLGAIARAGARRPPAPLAKPQSLEQIACSAQSWWQPVVVFPEGARTNGSCVLSWKATTFAGMTSFDKPVGAAVLSMEYSKTGAYTPHHTVGTTFRHLFWICMQPYHTLRTVWLPASAVADANKDKPMPEKIAFLRTLLARMIRTDVGGHAVEVEVTAAKHMDFMAFWDASKKKGYTKNVQGQAATGSDSWKGGDGRFSEGDGRYCNVKKGS
jgi:1-acyl-sn-glycerol-3-phosphate acyltransferase